MTQTQILRLRKALEMRQGELVHTLLQRDDIQIERAADTLDDLQNAALRDFAVEQLNRDSIFLRRVEAALSRIEHGHYGICLNCNGEINDRRLEAIPWAELCIRCQEAADSSVAEEAEADHKDADLQILSFAA